MKTNILIVALFITFFYMSSAFSENVGAFQHHTSGLYTGFILGGQWGHSRDKTGSLGYNADNDVWQYHESGFHAGAELGYNYLFQRILIGPEIELGYLGMKGSAAQPLSPALDTQGKSNSNFYTALRARAGFLLDKALLYGTAGAIGSHYQSQIIDTCNIAPCGGSTINANKNGFIWGYTAGAGVEHWFQEDWSIKLEYLYFKLNNQHMYGASDLGDIYGWSAQSFGNVIRVGVRYHM